MPQAVVPVVVAGTVEMAVEKGVELERLATMALRVVPMVRVKAAVVA